jgi:hypothetical protein
MVKLLTTILIATTLVVPPASAEERELRKYIGEGANSCGAWTFERQQNSTKSALYATWVLGYVSGQNADASTTNFLQGVDAGAILGWIDNYCRSNPLEKIVTAAGSLVVELVLRVERKP